MSNTYEVGQSDRRPWGEWRVVLAEEGYAVKRIVVARGQRLSLQSHRHRDEHWIVAKGSGRATIGEKTVDLRANQSIWIPAGTMHRIENSGSGDMIFVEVLIGVILSEDDIWRYSDDYGRS